jgi:hypothetical protein
MISKTKMLAALTTVSVAGFSSTVVAGTALGQPLSVTLPFGDGSLVGLAAAGIVGAVWLARRKEK